MMRCACPTGEYFGLDVTVIWSHHPVGNAVYHRITERFEARDYEGRRRRPERRTEAFVHALMRVHPGGNGCIERIRSSEPGAPVIAQRCVKRSRARGERAREPVEPGARNQIEQGRCRDQIDWPIERGFEVTVQIE